MSDLLSILKSKFGYDQFRGSQKEIILHTIDGNNSLVIMPTGGGKSLCYQLPSLVLNGTAIVISPLIALMQDQVDALRANGIAAAAINSSIPPQVVRSIEKQIGSEDLKLVYVSPEKAVTPSFIDIVSNRSISLVAVDESHCVSVWGNDFRKDYTLIPRLLEKLPGVPVMGLTATADKTTQEDIIQKLQLKKSKKFISSFERSNLHLRVLPANGRTEHLVNFVKEHREDSGIIYCLSRKSTENVAARLKQSDIRAAYYHADMPSAERHRIQRAFQVDELKVICATIAFGMGIDKSNVRYVLHYNLPKNLESYYQEIGRAGRDGLPAETILYFSLSDSQILRAFIDQSEADEIYKIVQRSKLGRMTEFGNATSCRTNMILSYFGEHRSVPCGHCDNCLFPPDSFDGTEIAQKALSAISRLQERVGINMLVDVLRGSEKESLLKMGFHKIKTYGAGNDLPRSDWMNYISQLINKGFLEVEYRDYNKLKITSIGNSVLFKKMKVDLTSPVIEQKPVKSHVNKKANFNEDLFEHLRQVRSKLAKEENVPPYIIFHDATLKELAAKPPIFTSDLNQITGIGEHKLKKYGKIFLEEIQQFVASADVSVVKGKTYNETLVLYKKGLTPEEIAERRDKSIGTIYNHLLKLFQNGEKIDITGIVPEEHIRTIQNALDQWEHKEKISELYEILDGKYSYDHLKLALAYLE